MLQLNKNRSTQTCMEVIKREWRKSIAILLALALSFAIIANMQSFGNKTNDIGRTTLSGCKEIVVYVYFNGFKKERIEKEEGEGGTAKWKVTGQSTVTYDYPTHEGWRGRFIVSCPQEMRLPDVTSWIKPEFVFTYKARKAVSAEISKDAMARHIRDKYHRQFIAKNREKLGRQVTIKYEQIKKGDAQEQIEEQKQMEEQKRIKARMTAQEEIRRYCAEQLAPIYGEAGDPQLGNNADPATDSM